MPDGSVRETLLGCASPEQYIEQTAFLGASIGMDAPRKAVCSIYCSGDAQPSRVSRTLPSGIGTRAESNVAPQSISVTTIPALLRRVNRYRCLTAACAKPCSAAHRRSSISSRPLHRGSPERTRPQRHFAAQSSSDVYQTLPGRRAGDFRPGWQAGNTLRRPA